MMATINTILEHTMMMIIMMIMIMMMMIMMMMMMLIICTGPSTPRGCSGEAGLENRDTG